MANQEVVDKIKAAIGDKGYAAHIIAEAEKSDPDKKYGQDALDRLHEMAGVLAAYARIHANAGEEAKATTEDEKLALVKKAIAAIS